MASSAHIWVALAFVVGTSATAVAHPDDMGEAILPPPPTYRANGVTVDEHVGVQLPLDASFRTQDGTTVTLGDLMKGELPTILTFNYSDCPMLCSLQLNGLSSVLPLIATPAPVSAASADARDAAFRVGQQFRMITIDLEPNDSPAKLAKMKARYVDRLLPEQRATAATGWTFLAAATVGDSAAIHRVADSVGFKYTYLEDKAEYAHPAALIFLSATGVVTRYVYGVDFDPAIMRESIFKAGLAESATAVGFMNRCYHYDPDANSHARAGVLALRIGAVGFLVLLVSGFGVMQLVRKNRRDHLPTRGDT